MSDEPTKPEVEGIAAEAGRDKVTSETYAEGQESTPGEVRTQDATGGPYDRTAEHATEVDDGKERP
jgi:hypothetical protein